MLGRRRRRRANIVPTLVQCLVFAGVDMDLMLDQCRASIGDAGPTLMEC